jgi:hypothetical protein
MMDSSISFLQSKATVMPCWRRSTFLLHLLLFCSNINALSTSKTNSNNIMSKNVRIELFFKTNQELKERVSWLQKQHGVTAFNLVNKHADDPLHEWVDIIREQCKAKVDISVHYSLKFQKVKRKTPVEHYVKFQSFLQNHRATEVLLVSGSIKSDVWNSAVALQKLTKDSADNKDMVAVAYNPFFPDQRIVTRSVEPWKPNSRREKSRKCTCSLGPTWRCWKRR